MAMIQCPECGREISDAAAACPNCGFPLSRLAQSAPAVAAQVAQREVVVVRRGFALAAAILGTLALVLCGAFAVGNYAPFLGDADFVGALASGAVVQVVFLTVAAACNWVGYASRARGLVLTAGILYCVALAVFLVQFLFIVLPLIFAFVGYSRMRPRRMTVEEYVAQ